MQTMLPQSLRQLGDIRRDPPRFIFGEQLGRRTPPGSSLKRLTWCSSYQALKVWT
jgi:hypothetical protein